MGDQVLELRKAIFEQEDIFKPASPEEVAKRFEQWDEIDDYIGTVARGKACSFCGRRMPAGEKYLGISVSGRRYNTEVKTCKLCLAKALKKIG